MKNEDRQTVIDALELGKEIANGEGCRVFDGDFDAALAIMRRDAKQKTVRLTWIDGKGNRVYQDAPYVKWSD